MATVLLTVDGKTYAANENGYYRFTLAPSKHPLRLEHDGLRSFRTTVNVKPGDSVQVNFNLRFAD